MRLLKENAEAAPSTFFATLLNAPCSSLMLTSATEQSTVYLVVGKSNGETVFFPTDRSENISKFECESSIPVTALAAGDLRHIGRREVVTVTANGTLQLLNYPAGETPCPTLAFSQQIYANVCFAEILDVDGDGRAEFLVAMTDRVVRLYRYCNEADRLVPLNKWEMPSHISGCSIDGGSVKQMFLSQCNRDQYVQLEFGTALSDGQLAVWPRSITETTVANDERTSRDDFSSEDTWLIVAHQPYATQMFQSLVDNILVVDKKNVRGTRLQYDGVGITCITTIMTKSGIIFLVAVDSYGQMLIYAWQEENNEIKWREPIARCQVSRDVYHIGGCTGGHEFTLVISIVNIYNKIAIFSVDLNHILSNSD